MDIVMFLAGFLFLFIIVTLTASSQLGNKITFGGNDLDPDAKLHERDVPVIYTVMSYTHHRLDRPLSGMYMPNRYPELEGDYSKFFMDGKVWHEIAPKESDVVIHKCSYGAFHETPLQSILNKLGRDTIIICGTLTNYCCGRTAR